MEKLKNIYQNKKRIFLPVLGVLAVSLIGFIYVLLGEGSYVEVHDQMDGEILNYIYQAKYLFQGDIIPEFMNGMDKASMTPPAPLAVLFYKVLPPFAAFAAVQWMVVVVGFLGMYFLCRYLGTGEEAAFLGALLFGYMPFYPTYGLAALGQPLLILCYLQFVKGEKKWLPLLGIVFYAAMSSLTLVGFVWILLGGLHVLYLLYKKEFLQMRRSIAAVATLTVTYICTNLDLFTSFFGENFTTHREEMVLTPTADLWEKFKELLLTGGSYSKTYASLVLWLAVLVFFIGKFGEHEEAVERNKKLKFLLTTIFAMVVFALLWNSSPVVSLRNAIGGMVTYFQADRVYWTFPFLWMVVFAIVIDYLLVLFPKYKDIPVKILLGGMACSLCLLQGFFIFRDSTLNKNLRLLLVDGYEQVTWEGLYMEDVFDEIEAALEEDKSSYSVVSLGMYPSVALYNGFTCADGYSNNYDLEYKHIFREIMAPELEKNKTVRLYFDQWGNRCYLATAQTGFDMMMKKGTNFVYQKPDYDFYTMEKLNIRYIFAAAPINDEKYQKMLVEGSPFSSETSYYEVWVYDIQKR